MYTDDLLKKYPIISDQVTRQELRTLLIQLETLLQHDNQKGAVVEFGCYIGTTSLFIRRLLDLYDSTLEFHVYDSFEGLPEKALQDESVAGDQFKAGELHVTKRQFIEQFKKAGLRTPVIHKGWFSNITEHDVPERVRFAFLDGDYYESIKTPLALLTPRFTSGAVVIVDDYMNEALPGAAKATDEWVRQQRLTAAKVQASLGIIVIP